MRKTSRILFFLFSILLFSILQAAFAGAEEISFHNVKVPDAKGKQHDAVLTFSDNDKAVEVKPSKGNEVTIPYDKISKFSYEFTKRHRVNEETVFSAPVGVGAVVMLTKSRSHWLEIDYRDQDLPKAFVVRMDKKNYIRILDAVKAHTGQDVDIVGNARKR